MQEVKTDQRLKAIVGIVIGITAGIISGLITHNTFIGMVVAVVMGLGLSAALTHKDTPARTGTRAPGQH